MKYTNIIERTAFCLQLIIVRERACLLARERAFAYSHISHHPRLNFPPLIFIFLILGVLLSLDSSPFVFIHRSYIHSCILIGVHKEYIYA